MTFAAVVFQLGLQHLVHFIVFGSSDAARIALRPAARSRRRGTFGFEGTFRFEIVF